jgi:hypothetical protein
MAVKVGDRVAQLVLERIYTPEVKEVDSLEETARGAPHYTVAAPLSGTPQLHTPAALFSTRCSATASSLHCVPNPLPTALCSSACCGVAGEGGFGSTGVSEAK